MQIVGEEGKYALIYAIVRGVSSADVAFKRINESLNPTTKKEKYDFNKIAEFKEAGYSNKEIAEYYGTTANGLRTYVSKKKKGIYNTHKKKDNLDRYSEAFREGFNDKEIIEMFEIKKISLDSIKAKLRKREDKMYQKL